MSRQFWTYFMISLALVAAGVALFDRETILTRWK